MMATFFTQRLRDRGGINWRELWRAYRVFMPDPAGICSTSLFYPGHLGLHLATGNRFLN